MNGQERRSGEERRQNPPTTCAVPCKPIDDRLREVMSLMETKFQQLMSCVKSKVSAKLFFWAFGGLAFFTVVVIGGFQWKILDKVSAINTSVQVMQVTVNNTQYDLRKHTEKSETTFDKLGKRIRDLEHDTHLPDNP
jgi:hypothetical protein